MAKPEMSDSEAAEFYYEHRDDPDMWGEPVEARVSLKPDGVASVHRAS